MSKVAIFLPTILNESDTCHWSNIIIFLFFFNSLSESECGGNSPNSSMNMNNSSAGSTFGSLWGSEMPLAAMYPDTSLNGDDMEGAEESNNISEASNDSNLMMTAT